MAKKPERFGTHALAVFAACAVLYFGGFWLVQHWRVRRGPWEVTFRTEDNGLPVVAIRQPQLGLDQVTLAFPGTNLAVPFVPVTVRFDQPGARTEPPFGQVKFLDPTFLPGTVTLDLFGHEIELLPRTLIVDRHERAWRSGERLELPAR